MYSKAKISAKTPKTRKRNVVSHTRKALFFQSTNLPVDHILYLQRTIGNQAVQRMMKSGVIQAKLKIGQPNDKQRKKKNSFNLNRLPNRLPPWFKDRLKKKQKRFRQTLAQFKGDTGEAENHTSLPRQLKAGLEQFSGLDLSGVRVHSGGTLTSAARDLKVGLKEGLKKAQAEGGPRAQAEKINDEFVATCNALVHAGHITSADAQDAINGFEAVRRP